MMLRRQRSTLFPYTTLFRSDATKYEEMKRSPNHMKLAKYVAVGLLLVAWNPAPSRADIVDASVWVSLKKPGNVDGIDVKVGDIVACRPRFVGTTPHCEWSLMFDGSD